MEQALSKCCDKPIESSDEVCTCIECKKPCDWYIKVERPAGTGYWTDKYSKWADRRSTS